MDTLKKTGFKVSMIGIVVNTFLCIIKLIIGHYSSRCQDASLYQAECRTVFPNTFAASDGDVFDLPFVKQNTYLCGDSTQDDGRQD